jgi:ribonuclease-3
MSFFRYIKTLLRPKTPQERKIAQLIGFYPINMDWFDQAFTHKSVKGSRHHNERLEYLGDAIFGSVVAEYVFKKFPNKEEGFLTQTRSKMVSRKTLNQLALDIHLDRFLKHQVGSHRSIYGNALEALIGAIFLDQGYQITSHFIETQLIDPYLNLDLMVKEVNSYKGKLLEWGQAHKINIEFKRLSSFGKDHEKSYEIAVLVDQKTKGKAIGSSVKRAEEMAAKKAYEDLIKS